MRETPLLCSLAKDMFMSLGLNLWQFEVATVCEASLSASLQPALQPVWKLTIPADSQGAQPTKCEVGSVASQI